MKSHSRITTLFAAALTMVFASDVLAGRGGERPRGEAGPRAERGERFGRGGPRRMAARHMGHLAMLDLLLAEAAPAGFTVENFPDADTDGDGALSDAEWQSFADDHKAKMSDRMMLRDESIDTDASGDLDDTELAAFAEAQEAEMKERMLERHTDADTDGDGVLSDAEFAAFETPWMERMIERAPEADLNGDGVLGRDEWAIHMLANGPALSRSGPDGPRGAASGIGKHDRLRHRDGSCDGKGGKSKSTE